MIAKVRFSLACDQGGASGPDDAPGSLAVSENLGLASATQCNALAKLSRDHQFVVGARERHARPVIPGRIAVFL
jgi:hypothetical protein